MVKVRKPNTICRNPNCKHGENGEPKHFYACLSCLRGERWRSYCCCVECYNEYTQLVIENREKEHKEHELPLRTDMTEKEIKQVMETPQRVVDTYTKEVELKDYFDDNPTGTIADAVESINNDIDKKRNKSRRKKSDSDNTVWGI